MLAVPLLSILEEVLECNFVNGLTPIIRAEVRIMRSRGLAHTMVLAQRVEDGNEVINQAQL